MNIVEQVKAVNDVATHIMEKEIKFESHDGVATTMTIGDFTKLESGDWRAGRMRKVFEEYIAEQALRVGQPNVMAEMNMRSRLDSFAEGLAKKPREIARTIMESATQAINPQRVMRY